MATNKVLNFLVKKVKEPEAVERLLVESHVIVECRYRLLSLSGEVLAGAWGDEECRELKLFRNPADAARGVDAVEPDGGLGGMGGPGGAAPAQAVSVEGA